VKYSKVDFALVNKIGNDVGYLFQIIDDLLDFKGEDKTLLADLKNGNINYFLLKLNLDQDYNEDELSKLNFESIINLVIDDIKSLTTTINNDFKTLLESYPQDSYSSQGLALFEFFVDQLANRYKQ
jgi:geranylgeranyl pyrophosphate synthase